MKWTLLNRLTLKEQDQLILIAAGLLVILLNALFWMPISAQNTQLRSQLEEQQGDLQKIQSNLERMKGQAAVGVGEGDIVSQVNALARKHDLTIDYFQPSGSGGATISINAADNKNLMPWLLDLEQSGLTLQRVTLSGSSVAGKLAVRLMVESPR